MKRKIAILLSAMMVTSAMPMTASAAQLKSSTVLNQGYAKANETIDPGAKNYGTYNTADQLKGRRSVLKIDLVDDKTDAVPAGTSFYVDLENGKFTDKITGDANQSPYAYMNIKGVDGSVIKITDMFQKPGDYSLTNLKPEYKSLASTWANFTGGEILAIDTPIGKTADANNAEAKAIFDKLVGTTQDVADKTTIDNLVTAEIPKLLAKYTGTKGTLDKDLYHIPYVVEYVSPTRLKVTTIQTLSNDDKAIKVSNNNFTEADLELQYFLDEACTQPFVFKGTSTPSSKIEEIKGIKVVAKKDVEVKTSEIKDPYIALPLGAVEADGNGPVKATVTAEYNDKVSGNSSVITKGLENNSTSLVYDAKNVKYFDDKTVLEQVTIKENVRESIGKNNDKTNAVFTVRLSGGFEFTDINKIIANPSNYFSAEGKYAGSPTFTVTSPNNSTLVVTASKLGGDRRDPIGIAIKNVGIQPIDERNYGNVDLTVSGDGINTQTVKVAVREKLGFKLETLKDAQDMIVGRHYQNNNKANMIEADNTTVYIKFSEAIPNTLVTSRNLDFNLPEGVKIVRAELENNQVKNITGLDDSDFDIINNGRTLRLNRVTNNDYTVIDRVNNVASFVMKLNLSIDPAFTGDVKLSVVGGGQSEGTTPEVTVAKAKLPFEVKTETTKVDLGYQDYNTANITITEVKPGMFLEGETAVLKLIAPYGTSELGFSEAQFEVSGGELSVKEKDFKVNKGEITFKVDKASYKNPSTITIKNVKIGSTRSVPFGSYSLAIGGGAVINNYKAEASTSNGQGGIVYDKKVDLEKANAASGVTGVGSTTENEVNGLRYQDKTEYYEVKNYVNVVTATGTFNETVKVTVGEKTVLVGGKAIDMDVAPYIQATSNSTMVPLRFVSVALGVDSENVANPDASNKISWDANTKTTTIYYGAGTGQKIIQFQAGSNIMVVDGTRIPMEYGVKAEIKDGRMFVPFRALGQALGVTVTWDADTRTAIYNDSNARNANTTTTASTTATSTTATSTTVSSSSTTQTTTSKESSTETTTASKDSTTETTTKK